MGHGDHVDERLVRRDLLGKGRLYLPLRRFDRDRRDGQFHRVENAEADPVTQESLARRATHRVADRSVLCAIDHSGPDEIDPAAVIPGFEIDPERVAVVVDHESGVFRLDRVPVLVADSHVEPLDNLDVTERDIAEVGILEHRGHRSRPEHPPLGQPGTCAVPLHVRDQAFSHLRLLAGERAWTC